MSKLYLKTLSQTTFLDKVCLDWEDSYRLAQRFGGQLPKTGYDTDFILYDVPCGGGKTSVLLSESFLRFVKTHPEIIPVLLFVAPKSLAKDAFRNFKKVFEGTNIQVLWLDDINPNLVITEPTIICSKWAGTKSHTNKMKWGTFEALSKSLDNSSYTKIMVRDEAQDEKDTTQSRSVLEMWNPSIIVDLTATPRGTKARWHNILREDDMESDGLLKNLIPEYNFHWDEYITDDNQNSFEIQSIEAALKNNQKVEQSWKENGITQDVPASLWFIENGESAREKRNLAIQKLGAICGITEENIAGMVGDEKDSFNEEKINESGSKIKIIITKVKGYAGFDCPRINSIVLMRTVVSPIVLKQILGRGMRSYKHKKWNNFWMDTLFVWGTQQQIKQCKTIEPKGFATITTYVKPNVLSLGIKMKIPGRDARTGKGQFFTAEFSKVLTSKVKEKLTQSQINKTLSHHSSMVKDAKIQVNATTGQYAITGGTRLEQQDNEVNLQKKFDSMMEDLRRILNQRESRMTEIQNCIYDVLKNEYGLNASETREVVTSDEHRSIFREVWSATRQPYFNATRMKQSISHLKDTIWELTKEPRRTTYNADEVFVHSEITNSGFDQFIGRCNGHEKNYAILVNDRVIAIERCDISDSNAPRCRYFSSVDQEIHTYFPDFWIIPQSSAHYYIVEIKAEKDINNTTIIEKAKAMWTQIKSHPENKDWRYYVTYYSEKDKCWYYNNDENYDPKQWKQGVPF